MRTGGPCGRSVVPDLLRHRQPLPSGRINGAIGRSLELVLQHPHELARMLACMPRRALQELVTADVAVVDLGLVVPIGALVGGLPPTVEPPSHVGPIGDRKSVV